MTPDAPLGERLEQAAAAKPGGTEYIILRHDPDTDDWAVISDAGDGLRASSAGAAIRAHAGEYSQEGLYVAVPAPGLYVAVPARSWKPVKVATKTQTRIVLEDA